jgi:hypothetical protein
MRPNVIAAKGDSLKKVIFFVLLTSVLLLSNCKSDCEINCESDHRKCKYVCLFENDTIGLITCIKFCDSLFDTCKNGCAQADMTRNSK